MNKIRAILVGVVVLALGAVSTTAIGYAETQTASVPTYLTIEATSFIDVTIGTDTGNGVRIVESGENSGSGTATIRITNNNTSGVIKVDSISVVPQNGWQLVGSNSDFPNMKSDSGKISFTYGAWDFSRGTLFNPGIEIGPTISGTVNFDIKLCPLTKSLYNVKVAETVFTLSIK